MLRHIIVCMTRKFETRKHHINANKFFLPHCMHASIYKPSLIDTYCD
jgi:hypothetical protein